MQTLIEPKEPFFLLLKKEVEEEFGKKIDSSRDCLLLSEVVYGKTSYKINFNTLRRFFGLVKSDFSPSATTLDILSKFCDFASFDEFRKLKNTANRQQSEDYYSGSILAYLVSLFKQTPVKEGEDKTFAAVVKSTIRLLQRHPELCDPFQRAIAKTKAGQDFYYEQFVNIDGLASFYGTGLRYYLAEKATVEAQIFGHSVLCFKEWASQNPAGVKRHYDEVIGHPLSKTVHPFLMARFFATQLLYADCYGEPAEKILAQAQQAHTAIRANQQKDSYRHFPCFEYIISPVLVLTGHPEEAGYYTAYSYSRYLYKHAGSMEHGFYGIIDIIHALTLVASGKKEEAEKIYQRLHPSKFYFLTKKITTIFYLVLGQRLKKNSHKSHQQLEELILETGFIRLRQLFEAYHTDDGSKPVTSPSSTAIL